MPIETYCANPACRKRFLVPESTAGKPVRCKSCGETFVASASETATGSAPARPAESSPSRSSDGVGTKLGRFEIRRRLGAGAFGTVYRAFDPILDRDVALKVPNPGVMDDQKKRERFLREAKASAGLRHPHIVAVFDAGRDGDRYYIASAFIEGKPLSDSIPEGGTDFARAARLVRELAEALAYAHEQGIVHRDVKPQNIMTDAQDRALLTDFGIAARLDDSRITQDGARLGTAAYMAPEQAAGQKGEAQSACDQYSAGVVLYELLTGETPFSGPADIQIFNAIHTAPPSPRSLRPDVPRDLETICLKALAKRSEDRYADCQELADDLRRWLEGEPITARRMGLRERFVRWVKKEPKLAGTTLALAVVLVASVVLVSLAAAEAEEARQQAELSAKQATEDAARARTAEAQAERAAAERQAALDKVLRVDKQLEGALGTKEEERARAIMYRNERDLALKKSTAAREQADRSEKTLASSEYRRGLQVAYQALRDGNREDAGTQLQAVRAEQRGWEWRYLQKLCDTPRFAVANVLTLGEPGPEGLSAAKFSPDGSRVLTVGVDGTIRLWDARTGREAVTLANAAGGKRDPEDVSAASFSPNGRLVVAIRKREYPRVWDAAGKEVGFFEGAGVTVQAAEFDPGGTRLVTASRDRYARVWDLATKKESAKFSRHEAEVDAAVFSPPDGKRVATAGRDGTVRVWDAATGTELLLCKPETPAKKPIAAYKPAFSPDGRFVAAVCADHAVRLWEIDTRKELPPLLGQTAPIRSVAFSADGRSLVTAGEDGTARLWDALSLRPTGVLSGHNGVVASAAFRPGGSLVVTAGEDGTARVWDAKTGKELAKLEGHTKPVYGAAFSPDGSRVLTSSHDGTARLWSFGPDKLLPEYAGPGSWLGFSPDWTRRLSIGGDGTVRVLDAVTGLELLAIRLPSPANSVAWDADGNVIAGHPDGTARVLAASPR